MRYFVILFLLFPIASISQKKAPIKIWEAFPGEPDNYVTDRANILSQSEQAQLNSKLHAFEERTTNQIFIYLAESLDGKDLEDFSREIFNAWGVGQKDKDNGVLIAVFINDRSYRIQVGKGLESTLPSDVTLIIQDEHMQPHFKAGNYYGGIDAGVDKLIYYSEHELSLFERYKDVIIFLGIAYAVSIIFFVINVVSVKKWKRQPKRRMKNILASTILLLIPGLGTIGLIGLCWSINDTSQSKFSYETDDEHDRRMQREREREHLEDRSSSDTDFSGGGGGSSDDGGSSSRW